MGIEVGDDSTKGSSINDVIPIFQFLTHPSSAQVLHLYTVLDAPVLGNVTNYSKLYMSVTEATH